MIRFNSNNTDTIAGIVSVSVFSGWIDFSVGTSCYSCCCEDRYNCCTPCFVGVRTIFSAAIWISLSCYRATLVSIALCLAASVAVAIVFAVVAIASVVAATVAVAAAAVCRRSL